MKNIFSLANQQTKMMMYPKNVPDAKSIVNGSVSLSVLKCSTKHTIIMIYKKCVHYFIKIKIKIIITNQFDESEYRLNNSVHSLYFDLSLMITDRNLDLFDTHKK